MPEILVSTVDATVDVEVVGGQGPVGPVGPEGPRGPKGDPGSSFVHVHYQAVLSTLWFIQHNLGKHPTVFVEDGGGTQIYGTVTYLDDNSLTVAFQFSATGRANCS